MRTAEKYHRKQESSNLPTSIKMGVKIIATVIGFYIWGVEFVWVVLGLTFCYRILQSILSCLVSLISLIGFFYFLITHIF